MGLVESLPNAEQGSRPSAIRNRDLVWSTRVVVAAGELAAMAASLPPWKPAELVA